MPPSAPNVTAQVRINLDQEQFVLALQQTDTVLAQEPNKVDFLALKAEALLGLAHSAEALALGVQLVQRDASQAAHWLVMCRALHGVSCDELALRSHTAALTCTTPNLSLARFRGDALFETNRFEEARIAYALILPDYGSLPAAWRLWYNYSTCLYAAGEVAESQTADRRALRGLQQLLATGDVIDDKRRAHYFFHQGMLYFRVQQWLLAEQAFGDALRLDGSNLAAFWLRNTYRKEGKRLGAFIGLPWALWVYYLDIRRKSAAQENMLDQRAAVPDETLQAVEALIAR